MRGWRTVAALVGLAALVLAACGSGAAKTNAAASQCRRGTGLTQTAATHRYTMVLNLGSSEAMYTPAQVAAQHLTSGEVMLRGQMTEISGAADAGSSTSTTMEPPTTIGGGSPTTSTMPMGQTTVTGMTGSSGASAARHLEVHICSVSTGQVVQDARPTITLADHSSGGMSDQVPVAVMEGVGQGAADLHYGNNITMPGGHRYTVTVRLNGDTATFKLTSPN